MLRVVNKSVSSIKVALIATVGELLNLCCLEEVRVFNESLCRCLIRKVCVNIPDVCFTLKLGHVRRRDLSGHQFVPVNRLKEWVCLDLLNAETILRITRE